MPITCIFRIQKCFSGLFTRDYNQELTNPGLGWVYRSISYPGASIKSLRRSLMLLTVSLDIELLNPYHKRWMIQVSDRLSVKRMKLTRKWTNSMHCGSLHLYESMDVRCLRPCSRRENIEYMWHRSCYLMTCYGAL